MQFWNRNNHVAFSSHSLRRTDFRGSRCCKKTLIECLFTAPRRERWARTGSEVQRVVAVFSKGRMQIAYRGLGFSASTPSRDQTINKQWHYYKFHTCEFQLSAFKTLGICLGESRFPSGSFERRQCSRYVIHSIFRFALSSWTSRSRQTT
mgnify:CR=1 FL=1